MIPVSSEPTLFVTIPLSSGILTFECEIAKLLVLSHGALSFVLAKACAEIFDGRVNHVEFTDT